MIIWNKEESCTSLCETCKNKINIEYIDMNQYINKPKYSLIKCIYSNLSSADIVVKCDLYSSNWQDMDNTFTTNERATSILFDCLNTQM